MSASHLAACGWFIAAGSFGLLIIRNDLTYYRAKIMRALNLER